ncbi:hypothetical protein HNQ80_000522 [Anaerosolibacter carboniphilus]|uniref:Uncharacterized protein n=1 Tax=Anaerosolibacter carboniphilus TaxID=1417629 RepID=A0A841KU30_9FIRM|nr:hypothetical protein [Anaerosolibacter carboniphilus]MBB6214442.1 hypothetical protein [Anaerosolibacter carboniphilus]
MKIYVNVKQAGTRKSYITQQEIYLKSKPSTLRELIANIVSENVEEFNHRHAEQKILNYLTSEEINDRVTVGRVSFGDTYNPTKAKLEKALENAFLAYEDGIFRVFIGDKEAGCLDEPLDLREEDVLTFIRLTMLAGRMW